MRYEEYIFIRSDINTLRGLLDRMPEDRDVERIGLESRLRKQEAKLEGVTPPEPPRLLHITMPTISASGEPCVRPDDLLAISEAATMTAGDALLLREIKGNHITLEAPSQEAHRLLAEAILEIGQGTPNSRRLREASERTGAEWHPVRHR